MSAQLKQKLTLYGLTMIAIGSVIGVGIFRTPNGVIQEVPHHGWALLAWTLGGVIALTGALTFAELGGMFPKAGGVYVFLKEAYGEAVGFLYGWIMLFVVNAGALAALSLVFAEYMEVFTGELTTNSKIIMAIVTMTFLTGMNMVGIQIGQVFANLFTGLKLLALFGIIVAGIYYFQTESPEVNFNLSQNQPANLMNVMLAALVGVLFAIGGWHHASYVAGEAINPQKTVPKAMVLGALTVTVVYILANFAYMSFLPLDELAQSTAVAGDSLSKLGEGGGKVASIIIAISVFGTIGVYTMTAPRIYFAMANDGLFFKKLAYIHPKYRTPVYAMAIQVVWASLVLIFFEKFEKIITYVTFMDLAFMTVAGTAVFLFRRTRKDAERPYKTWGYPIIPAIFVIVSGAFVVNTLFDKDFQNEAIAGLVLLVLGIGAYFIFKRKKTTNK